MAFLFRKNTADFYILKTFLGSLAFVFSLFVSIAFVIILFEELDTFRDFHIPFSVGLAYVFLRLPHELVRATPLIIVISMVSATGNLIRHKEMLMLFIAGYTPIRLSVPLIAFMSFLLVFLYWINENVSGPLSARADMLIESRTSGAQQGVTGYAGVWLHGEGNRVFRAQTFFPLSNRLENLSVFEFQGENRTLSMRLDAKNAVWNPDDRQWTMNDVNIVRMQEDKSIKTEILLSCTYSLDRVPDDFGAVTQNVERMSHKDLKHMVDSIRKTGEDPRIYLPDLRIKEAFPFAVFFLGILAYAMMLYFGSAGKASGIGLGLLACILYFLLLSLGKSFAQANAIPPWLGAWFPNMICCFLTVYFFNRLRTEI